MADINFDVGFILDKNQLSNFDQEIDRTFDKIQNGIMTSLNAGSKRGSEHSLKQLKELASKSKKMFQDMDKQFSMLDIDKGDIKRYLDTYKRVMSRAKAIAEGQNIGSSFKAEMNQLTAMMKNFQSTSKTSLKSVQDEFRKMVKYINDIKYNKPSPIQLDKAELNRMDKYFKEYLNKRTRSYNIFAKESVDKEKQLQDDILKIQKETISKKRRDKRIKAKKEEIAKIQKEVVQEKETLEKLERLHASDIDKINQEQFEDFKEHLIKKSRLAKKYQKTTTIAGSQVGMVKAQTDFRDELGKNEKFIDRIRNKIKGMFASFKDRGAIRSLVDIKAGFEMVYHSIMTVVRGIQTVLEKTMQLESGTRLAGTLIDNYTLKAIGGFEKLESITKNIVYQFGEEIPTVTSAMYKALTSGAPAENLEQVLEVGNKLAVGGNANFDVVLDGVTSLSNAFGDLGYDMDSLTRISDSMFTAMKYGKFTLEELSNNLGKVSTLTSNMGLSLEETLSSLAAITRTGLHIDEAATQMRGALKKLLDPSAQARNIMTELNIAWGQNALEGRPFIEVLIEIREKLESAGYSLSDIFEDIRGLQGMMSLTNNTMGTYNDLTRDMARANKNLGAVTENAFGKNIDTLERWNKRATAAWNTYLANFGTKTLQPIVKSWDKFIYNIFGTAEQRLKVAQDELKGFTQTYNTVSNTIGKDGGLITNEMLSNSDQMEEAIQSIALVSPKLAKDFEHMAQQVRNGNMELETMRNFFVNIAGINFEKTLSNIPKITKTLSETIANTIKNTTTDTLNTEEQLSSIKSYIKSVQQEFNGNLSGTELIKEINKRYEKSLNINSRKGIFYVITDLEETYKLFNDTFSQIGGDASELLNMVESQVDITNTTIQRSLSTTMRDTSKTIMSLVGNNEQFLSATLSNLTENLEKQTNQNHALRRTLNILGISANDYVDAIKQQIEVNKTLQSVQGQSTTQQIEAIDKLISKVKSEASNYKAVEHIISDLESLKTQQYQDAISNESTLIDLLKNRIIEYKNLQTQAEGSQFGEDIIDNIAFSIKTASLFGDLFKSLQGTDINLNELLNVHGDISELILADPDLILKKLEDALKDATDTINQQGLPFGVDVSMALSEPDINDEDLAQKYLFQAEDLSKQLNNALSNIEIDESTIDGLYSILQPEENIFSTVDEQLNTFMKDTDKMTAKISQVLAPDTDFKGFNFLKEDMIPAVNQLLQLQGQMGEGVIEKVIGAIPDGNKIKELFGMINEEVMNSNLGKGYEKVITEKYKAIEKSLIEEAKATITNQEELNNRIRIIRHDTETAINEMVRKNTDQRVSYVITKYIELNQQRQQLSQDIQAAMGNEAEIMAIIKSIRDDENISINEKLRRLGLIQEFLSTEVPLQQKLNALAEKYGRTVVENMRKQAAALKGMSDINQLSGEERAEYFRISKEEGEQKARETFGLVEPVRKEEEKKEENKVLIDTVEETREALTASLSSIEKSNEKVEKNTAASSKAEEEQAKKEKESEFDLDLTSITQRAPDKELQGLGLGTRYLTDREYNVEYEDYIKEMVNFRNTTIEQFRKALLNMGLEQVGDSSYEAISEWSATLTEMLDTAYKEAKEFKKGFKETMEENITIASSTMDSISKQIKDDSKELTSLIYNALDTEEQKDQLSAALDGLSIQNYISKHGKDKFGQLLQDITGQNISIDTLNQIGQAYDVIMNNYKEFSEMERDKEAFQDALLSPESYAYLEKYVNGVLKRIPIMHKEISGMFDSVRKEWDSYEGGYYDKSSGEYIEKDYKYNEEVRNRIQEQADELNLEDIYDNTFNVGKVADQKNWGSMTYLRHLIDDEDAWANLTEESKQKIYDFMREVSNTLNMEEIDLVTLGELIQERIDKKALEGALKIITKKSQELRSKFANLPKDLFDITEKGVDPLEPLKNKIKNTSETIAEDLYVITRELEKTIGQEAGTIKLEIKPETDFSTLDTYIQYIVSIGKTYKDALGTLTEESKKSLVEYRQAYMETVVDQEGSTQEYVNKIVKARIEREKTLKDIEKKDKDPKQKELLDKEIQIDLDKDGIIDTTTTLRDVLIREADATVAKAEEEYQQKILKLHKEFNQNYREMMTERLEVEDPMSRALLNMQETMADLQASGEFQEMFNQLFEITLVTQDKLKSQLKTLFEDSKIAEDLLLGDKSLDDLMIDIATDPEQFKEDLKKLEKYLPTELFDSLNQIINKLLNLNEQEKELTQAQEQKQQDLLIELRTNTKILEIKQSIARENFKLIHGEGQLIKQSTLLLRQAAEQLEFIEKRYTGEKDLYELATDPYADLSGLSETELELVKRYQSILNEVYEQRRKIAEATLDEHDATQKVAESLANESDLASSLINTFGSISKLYTMKDMTTEGSDKHKKLLKDRQRYQESYNLLSAIPEELRSPEQNKQLEIAETNLSAIDAELENGVVTAEQWQENMMNATMAIRAFKNIITEVVDKTGDIDFGNLASSMYDLTQGIAGIMGEDGQIVAMAMEVAKIIYDIFMNMWQSVGYNIAEQAKIEAMEQQHTLQILQDKTELLEYALDLNMAHVNSLVEQREAYAALLDEYEQGLNISSVEDAMDVTEEATNQATEAQQALDELALVDWGAWFDDTDDKWWDKYSDILKEIGFTEEDFKWGKLTKEAVKEALESYIESQETVKEGGKDFADLMNSWRDALRDQLETEADLRARINELRGNGRKAIENEITLIDRQLELSEELGLTDEERAELLLDRLELMQELKELEQERLEAQQEIVLSRAGLSGLDEYNQTQLELAATQDLITAKAYELQQAQNEGLGTDTLIELQQELLDLKNKERDLQEQILDQLQSRYQYQVSYVDAQVSLLEMQAKIADYDEAAIERLKLSTIDDRIQAKQEELDNLEYIIAERESLGLSTSDQVLQQIQLEEELLGLKQEEEDIQNRILDIIQNQFAYQSNYVDAQASLIEKRAQLAGYDDEEIEQLKLDLLDERIQVRQEELNNLELTIAEKNQLGVDTKNEVLERMSLEEEIINLQLERTDIQQQQLEIQEEQNKEMEKGNALYDEQLRSHLRSIIRARQIQDTQGEQENIMKAAKRMRDLGVPTDDIYRMLGVDIGTTETNQPTTDIGTIDTNITSPTSGIIGSGEGGIIDTEIDTPETEPTDEAPVEELPSIDDLISSIDDWIEALNETGDEDTFIETQLPDYLESIEEDLELIRQYLQPEEEDSALVAGEPADVIEENNISDTEPPTVNHDDFSNLDIPQGGTTFTTPDNIFTTPNTDASTLNVLYSINRNLSEMAERDNINNIGINVEDNQVRTDSYSDKTRNNVYYDTTMRG